MAVKRDPLLIISAILLIIGGLNWLVVAFGVNVVEAIFGPVSTSILTRLIYILVGLAAIYMLYPLYLWLTSPVEKPVAR
ncbi:hypothetical protein Mtc_0987 [Methanocella conradii HZ254]|uniref:DUF378 domain-containing protein n=1 Tax=Methanocella conradii (strain DSM 24694 / JCM 17849 / CGMCC 1.5162 / HZ254) TaxID=1041930 RepID=H8I5S5_METCZ|nr:DUF378 domain-containing protein [Methanocella conradii]AFC99742.1 hypothetical protein Mtc_0987 [Methanocella conradii HZ254]MDI6896542.1 DUF378 domain-containing protein [Methanocella conradii]